MYHFGNEGDLEDVVEVTRTSLNELRQEVTALKEDHHKEVEALREEIAMLQSTSQPTASSSRTPPDRISRQLSNLVKTLYVSMDIHFILNERYDSPRNLSIRRQLTEQLSSQQGQLGKEKIQRAVARLFQSLKKGAREDEPELRARIDKEARSRRQGARRRRLYIRRGKFVEGEDERMKWQQISSHFMSDESSDDEDLVMHKLPWRSLGEFTYLLL
jgi:aminopeptidase N